MCRGEIYHAQPAPALSREGKKGMGLIKEVPPRLLRTLSASSFLLRTQKKGSKEEGLWEDAAQLAVTGSAQTGARVGRGKRVER